MLDEITDGVVGAVLEAPWDDGQAAIRSINDATGWAEFPTPGLDVGILLAPPDRPTGPFRIAKLADDGALDGISIPAGREYDEDGAEIDDDDQDAAARDVAAIVSRRIGTQAEPVVADDGSQRWRWTVPERTVTLISDADGLLLNVVRAGSTAFAAD